MGHYPERKFAVVCERDQRVLKWMKPFRVQLPIHLRSGRTYEPDFVVETDAAKLLVEIKRRADLTSAKVQEHAQAAATWCRHASTAATAQGLKPWLYLLIPHDEVREATDIAGCIDRFRHAEAATRAV